MPTSRVQQAAWREETGRFSSSPPSQPLPPARPLARSPRRPSSGSCWRGHNRRSASVRTSGPRARESKSRLRCRKTDCGASPPAFPPGDACHLPASMHLSRLWLPDRSRAERVGTGLVMTPRSAIKTAAPPTPRPRAAAYPVPPNLSTGDRQWPRRDLNPHGDDSPRDFKSRASASFATRPAARDRSNASTPVANRQLSRGGAACPTRGRLHFRKASF